MDTQGIYTNIPAGGCMLSCGTAIPSGCIPPSGMSAASMGLLARACSRGGVILNDGRRVAAATVLACNVQTATLPAGAAAALAGAAQLLVATQAAAKAYVVPGDQSANVTLGDGDTMTVNNGGSATSTTIQSGGSQIISNGGKATSTTIQSGGELTVSDGGITSNATIAGGTHIVGNGGTATATTVSGGTLLVQGGGTANQVTITGGELRMAPGASGAGTLQGHGSAAVCTDDGCGTVDAGAALAVGGSGAFGSIIVSSGTLGVANGIQVNNGGAVTVNSGGTLSADGPVSVADNGAVTVSGGGVCSAAGISAAANATVSLSGGLLAAEGGIVLRQGLTGARGTVSAGTSLEIAGATQASGALNLSAGGTITATGALNVNEIYAGGDIDGGQNLTAVRILAGGTVTAATIDTAELSATSLLADELAVSAGAFVLAGGGASAGSMSFGGSAFVAAVAPEGQPALWGEEGLEIGDGLEILVPAGGQIGEYEGGYVVVGPDDAPASGVVIGRPVEASVEWKYAKNANGWFCAQVALQWQAGYESTISDMRLLFEDVVDGQGRLAAYLVDPATVLDPLGDLEEYGGAVYRRAPIDVAEFEGQENGARATYGVSDATMASAVDGVPRAERKVCLRIANRDRATIAGKTAILAWEWCGETFRVPLPLPAAQLEDPPPEPVPAPAPAACTVAFRANGGTGSMAVRALAAGAKLPANAFSRPGWVFLGWARTPDGAVAYGDGAAAKDLAAGGTATLYARWAKTAYRVAFDANGGTGTMSAQKMAWGAPKRLKANRFKRKGYRFAGWARSKDDAAKGKVAFKNRRAVKNLSADGATVRLYAVWKRRKK